MRPLPILVALFAVSQAIALHALLRRLGPARRRRGAERPDVAAPTDMALTIVVATLNEAERIGRCLDGLARQGAVVREILVVDSRSTDGTRDLVRAAAAGDPRIRLLTDPPLPSGWIGKAWALQHGAEAATSPWILGLDADTSPEPGLADAVMHAARRDGWDVVSFAPRFAGQDALERWIQPALLTGLVYRTGAGGDEADPERVLANGQCFLVRRALLLAHGGYAPVRTSFAEDVSLARHLARRGARVGFLDGSRLYRVRGYRSAGEMWREWGRSIDLKDATTRARLWGDVLLLVLTQALPIPVLCWALARVVGAHDAPTVALAALVAVNVALVGLRVRLLVALRGCYEVRGASFWLSPLADGLAVVRVALSASRRPARWRTRAYPASA